MRLPLFIRRYALLLIVAVVTAGPSVALADTTIEFTFNAQPWAGVCSVTASGGGSADLPRYNANLWEAAYAQGPLTLIFNTTGLAGDRNCYSTASNTDFVNAAGDVTLVQATSFSMTWNGSPIYFGGTTPRPFISSSDIPTNGMTYNLMWFVAQTIANPSAPPDAYTSTMTITLSNTGI